MKPYIIQLVSNPVWGGGEQFVLDLGSRLKAEGYGVEVVARPVKEVVRRFVDAGIALRRLPLRGNFDFISSVGLSRIIRKAPGPVVVHAHNFKTAANAVQARRLSGRGDVKIVVTRHLVKPGKTDGFHTELYRGIDRLIFVSALSRDKFLSVDPVVDRSKIEVIHISAGGAAAEPVAVPVDVVPALMWHGRIVPEKGLDVLIEALGVTSRPWRLKIAGTGTAKDVSPLVRRVKELGMDDRVEWLGYVKDIPAAIREHGVYAGVLPSVVPEAFGLAALDYMAQGVPVIVSNNGAQPEIVTDGIEGLLVPPGDVSALAQSLTGLLSDPVCRDAMGRAALRTVRERFTYDRFFADMAAMYADVCSK